MQIYGVRSNATFGVVLSEDELRGLLVVLFHLPAMLLSLLRQLFGPLAVAILVRLTGLYGLLEQLLGWFMKTLNARGGRYSYPIETRTTKFGLVSGQPS